MEESYPKRQKTLWEKEKLLITSNFSFSHSVFKRLVPQGYQKVSLCGNGLKNPEELLKFLSGAHVTLQFLKIFVDVLLITVFLYLNTLYSVIFIRSPEHNLLYVSFFGRPMSPCFVRRALCVVNIYAVDPLEATFLAQST